MEINMQKLMTPRNLAIGGGIAMALLLIALFAFSGRGEPAASESYEPVYDFVSLEGESGYSISYPGWWIKTELKNGIVLTNELGTARVIILSEEAVAAVPFAAIKELMLRDPSLTITEFTLIPGDEPTYWVDGVREDTDKRIAFTEVSFDADGIRYQIRAEDETGRYREVLSSIVASFDLTAQ